MTPRHRLIEAAKTEATRESLIVARNMLDDLIPLMDSWMGYLPPEGERAFKEWRADAWQVAQLAKGRHSEDFDGDYTTLASLKVKS